jgi:hypothetical protein
VSHRRFVSARQSWIALVLTAAAAMGLRRAKEIRLPSGGRIWRFREHCPLCHRHAPVGRSNRPGTAYVTEGGKYKCFHDYCRAYRGDEAEAGLRFREWAPVRYVRQLRYDADAARRRQCARQARAEAVVAIREIAAEFGMCSAWIVKALQGEQGQALLAALYGRRVMLRSRVSAWKRTLAFWAGQSAGILRRLLAEALSGATRVRAPAPDGRGAPALAWEFRPGAARAMLSVAKVALRGLGRRVVSVMSEIVKRIKGGVAHEDKSDDMLLRLPIQPRTLWRGLLPRCGDANAPATTGAPRSLSPPLWPGGRDARRGVAA